MFDHRRFLVENFGNAPGLVALLRAYDGPIPKDDTAYKWFQRGSIPADWLAILLAYLEIDRGAPVSTVQYLTEIRDEPGV